MCRQGFYQGGFGLLIVVMVAVVLASHAHAADPLQSGVAVETSLSAGTYRNYYIDVPANATKLTVTITEGIGDLDLFVKFGSPLSGATYGEVIDSADAVANSMGADESIELTPGGTPALREGRWYVAPANVGQVSLPVRFLLTATVEVAASVTPHKTGTSVNAEAMTPGNYLTWDFELTPGTVSGNTDVYAVIVPPGGPLFFLSPFGPTTEVVPYQFDTAIAKEGGAFFRDVQLSAGLPAGQYLFGVVLVKTAGDPFDTSDWMGEAAVASMTFSGLSPAQEYFIQQYGAPQLFIKSFSEEDGKVRVDETWVFLQKGLRDFFTNGVFIKEERIDTEGLVAQPSQYRPDQYSFDTTEQDVIARHGQPASIGNGPAGTGAFFSAFEADRHLVYNGAIFGFKSGKLVFVIPDR